MLTKEDFEKEIEILKEASKEKIIVVEGPSDKEALDSLGVKHVIVSRKPIYLVVEYIVKSKKPCIILTDLDKEGKHLYNIFNHELNQFGVQIDNRFREFLFQTKLRQIEGLPHYLKKIIRE
jgi:5S rRNA maturation endonuclease (ribonuclease M5)